MIHECAYGMGIVFLDSLESPHFEKATRLLLEKCRKFLIACIMSVLKRIPSNKQLLNNWQLLKPSSIPNFRFGTLQKAFSPLYSCIYLNHGVGVQTPSDESKNLFCRMHDDILDKYQRCQEQCRREYGSIVLRTCHLTSHSSNV